MKKITQFVETTRERYIEHRNQFVSYKRGGRFEIALADPCDAFSQERVWHNEAISDIGQTPEWTLVAMSILQRYHPEHSQFFILEEVELGVTTTQIGLNGQEEK